MRFCWSEFSEAIPSRLKFDAFVAFGWLASDMLLIGGRGVKFKRRLDSFVFSAKVEFLVLLLLCWFLCC